MNENIYTTLDSTLVMIFNDVLSIEGKALIVGEFRDISVNDMHIIGAVGIDEPHVMSYIANELNVTMGTLTIGINRLVKKGYVIRKKGEKDRRMVYATLTPKGRRAYEHHMNFHREMIEWVISNMDEKEAQVLEGALQRLEDFFTELKKDSQQMK